MDRKIIAYKADGTEVYEHKGIGCMTMLYCEGCGKLLSNVCGKKEIYCPSCAVKKGIAREQMMK